VQGLANNELYAGERRGAGIVEVEEGAVGARGRGVVGPGEGCGSEREEDDDGESLGHGR
jgi:hypothetical protein